MLEDKNIRKMYIWAVVLMIVGTFFVPAINAIISNESIKQQMVKVTITRIGSIGIKEYKIELPKSRFTELEKLFENSNAKDREKRIATLNQIFASHSLPLIYAENVNIEGKATDVYEFEYFSDYPPLIKLILMLLTGKSGKFLAFGYQERGRGTPTIERHSVGWIVINNTTNLSGVLWGTLSIVGDGKGRIYWVGVDGFQGTLITYPSGTYFIGHAKKVGIEAR